jgi:hypothetical protein
MKRYGPKTPSAVHGHLGITNHPNEKANVIAYYSEKQFITHDLCEENHEGRVETGVHAPLEIVDDPPLGKLTSCDIN